MKLLLFGWIAFGLLLPVAQGALLYKWVDDDGGVHFSDQPPPTNIKKFETGRARRAQRDEGTELPYALQDPVKNFPVVLYSSSCGAPCDQARDLLRKRGIPYTQQDAGEAAVQTELSKLLGGATVVVPVLTVGRALHRGFEEGAWNAALDNAGYPKTSVLPPNLIAPPKPAARTADDAKGKDSKGNKDSKEGEAPAKKSAGQYPVTQIAQ